MKINCQNKTIKTEIKFLYYLTQVLPCITGQVINSPIDQIKKIKYQEIVVNDHKKKVKVGRYRTRKDMRDTHVPPKKN